MHAVQCGEEGQVLSDFCFVGELRVDVLVGGGRLAGWQSKTAVQTPLVLRKNPCDGEPDAVKEGHGGLTQVADA